MRNRQKVDPSFWNVSSLWSCSWESSRCSFFSFCFETSSSRFFPLLFLLLFLFSFPFSFFIIWALVRLFSYLSGTPKLPRPLQIHLKPIPTSNTSSLWTCSSLALPHILCGPLPLSIVAFTLSLFCVLLSIQSNPPASWMTILSSPLRGWEQPWASTWGRQVVLEASMDQTCWMDREILESEGLRGVLQSFVYMIQYSFQFLKCYIICER